MAVDFNKINEKIEEERERAKGSNFGPRVLWWKPAQGENRLRLCPPWTKVGPNADLPFREVYRHWSIGEGGYVEDGGVSFTCPVRTPKGPGGVCEICNMVDRLRASGSVGDREIAKEITAKRRLYSNIIDLRDPVYTENDLQEWEENSREGDECNFEVGDTKVQVFSYGTTIYQQLLDYFQDEFDLCELTEPGMALKIVREGKGLNTSYRVRTDGKSKVFEFVGDMDKLLYNLDEIAPFPKEGAMHAALYPANDSPGLPPSSAPGLPPTETSGKKVRKALTSKEEEPPPCFNDGKTQDDDDPVCVGGKEDDGSIYDACSFLSECRKTKIEATSPPSRSRRRASKAPKEASTVEDVEAQMRELLS